MDIEWIRKNAENTGTCGEGLNWWQAGGNLYIEGQGAVASAAFISNKSIRRIVIAPGCTGIGDCAFAYCSLEHVELPEGMKHIGGIAFENCGLQTLTIPDSVEEIDFQAFNGIDSITYNGIAEPEPNDFQWGAEEWSCDPARRFHLFLHSKPDDRPSEVVHGQGNTINAYDGCIRWDGYYSHRWQAERWIPGTEMDMHVEPPFNCAVGGLFWVVCDREEYRLAEAKLLSVLEWHESSAKVRVRILQTRDMLSTLEPVSDVVKMKLRKELYAYYEIKGCTFDRLRWDRRQDLIHLYDIGCDGSYPGYDDTYTDADGIDHAVWWKESDLKDGCVFMGDSILGFRADSPYQWVNELFINLKAKHVLGCRRDAKEVIVPDGMERLKWCAFMNCPDLEQVTIPASVTQVDWSAFDDDLKSLKRIILTGDSKLQDKVFPKGVEIIRKPHARKDLCHGDKG